MSSHHLCQIPKPFIRLSNCPSHFPTSPGSYHSDFCPWSYLFWIFHIKRITQSVTSHVWLILFYIMFGVHSHCSVNQHFIPFCASVTQLCPTLCNPRDCNPPASSVHGILQARILEWVAVPFSKGSPNPGIEPGSQLCLHCRQILYGLSHQRSPIKPVRGLHSSLGWSVWKLRALSSTLEPWTRTGCR